MEDKIIIERQQRVFRFINRLYNFVWHSNVIITPEGYKLVVFYLFNIPVFQRIDSK